MLRFIQSTHAFGRKPLAVGIASFWVRKLQSTVWVFTILYWNIRFVDLTHAAANHTWFCWMLQRSAGSAIPSAGSDEDAEHQPGVVSRSWWNPRSSAQHQTRIHQLLPDQQTNPDTYDTRTDLVQLGCTWKQVAFQMFSSESQLIKNECADQRKVFFDVVRFRKHSLDFERRWLCVCA